MTPRLTVRSIVVLIGLAICIIAVVAVLVALDARKAGKRAEAGKTLSDGRTAAAQDASVVRDRADERNDETAAIVNQAEKEIRHAPDRNAAADATRRRVCQLSDFHDPQCAVYRTDPRRMD